MQLERLIHSQGFGSRKECRALIKSGAVIIDGETVDDPKANFDPAGLNFEVWGEGWEYRAKLYVMLNKPSGYECTHVPQFHPSIFGLFPAPLVERGLQSVGRLDQETTGLLLLSDDGKFIHQWSSGKKRIPKLYRAELKHAVDERLIRALLEGVLLHDETETLAAAACVQTGARSIELTVTEGKYHQVKRMVAAAGNRVERLHRSRIGGLTIPDGLAEGEWCWIEEAHLSALADWC